MEKQRYWQILFHRPIFENHQPLSAEVEVEHIHAVQHLVPDHQLKELQRETACDPTLQVLKTVILNGFPDSIIEARNYSNSPLLQYS